MILLKQMIVLFLIMIVGIICRFRGILNDEASKKISSIVVNVANPALILSAGINPENVLRGSQFIKTLGLAIGVFLIMFILAYIIPVILHIDKPKSGVYKVMMVFSNIAFMGFPLVSAIYGSNALIIASLFLIPYNVLIYTFGISAMASNTDNKEKFTFKETLHKIFNIGVIACIISIILYISAVHIPSVIENSIDYLSSLTAPLSMIIIGDSITKINFKELLKDWKLLVFAIIKMIIVPIIGVLALKTLGLSATLTGVCMIMLATPVGSMTVMLAQQYDGDFETASKGVALTTLMSVATIPLVSMITGV